ncbi:hypothetical protein [Sphingosinicella sp. BN140058]|uniref:hypothetical protein n=1 Tax=Sphingosinicella sp. BN140058 TaxID=1892855 RepID=UPI001012E166|nr:hypothetical protein [Sphingosinicella sp. BN140058]QAY79086.1 hypothetical protein ETR14_23020 [Sphingosinicella sp. BN140058]
MVTRFRPRLPERIPDFSRRALWLFRPIWFAALLLAIVGPIGGVWLRLTAPSPNSSLIPGSRAGLALDAEDLTRVRFTVGSAAASAGVRAGDDIVAIDTIPISAVVPERPGDRLRCLSGNEEAAVPPGTTALDYGLLAPLLCAGEDRPLLLTLRGTDGARRNVEILTGENHIEQAAAASGVPGRLLDFTDLAHLPVYPFLLACAWFLCRRREADVESSIVSLAILLTMAGEQPSYNFLATMLAQPALQGLGAEAVPRLLYDLANILLLTGVLLFPFGRLRPRWVLAVIAALPILLFVGGNIYRMLFIAFMAIAVDTLFRRLRQTPQSDERQQLKWALFGFAGYAVMLGVSLTIDMLKNDANGLGQQLALEMTAGFTFALAFLILQSGLLIALMKYRLYDAEAVISRSISVALITLILGAAFAGVMEGVKEIILRGFGQNAGSIAPIVGTAVSTILVVPVYERVQAWTERRFHRKLVDLRQGLPECLRDIRHFAPLREVTSEVLKRIESGVRPRRLAAVVDGKLVVARGVSDEEVASWLAAEPSPGDFSLQFDAVDKLFSIRIPLRAEEGPLLGWILVGARPDRSCLSSAERDALIEIMDPVARAVRMVMKREERERSVTATLHGLQRQIDGLRERLRIDRTGTAA